MRLVCCGQIAVCTHCVKACVNQLLKIVLGDDGRYKQEGRALVACGSLIGLCIKCAFDAECIAETRIDRLAFQHCLCKAEGNDSFVRNVLVNGHGLDAVNNVLKVGFVAVLTCDDDGVAARIVGGDRLGYAESGGVVGAEPYVKLSAVRIVGTEDVLRSLKCGVGAPLIGCDGDEVFLAGDDIQSAGFDVRRKDIVCAVEEVARVIVGRIACGELDVVNLVTRVCEVKSLLDELALKLADGVVIEGYIVGNSVVQG